VSRTTTQSGDDAGALVIKAVTAVTVVIPTHAISLVKTHTEQLEVPIKRGDIERDAGLQYHQRYHPD
jgi:hypothetical protein